MSRQGESQSVPRRPVGNSWETSPSCSDCYFTYWQIRMMRNLAIWVEASTTKEDILSSTAAKRSSSPKSACWTIASMSPRKTAPQVQLGRWDEEPSRELDTTHFNALFANVPEGRNGGNGRKTDPEYLASYLHRYSWCGHLSCDVICHQSGYCWTCCLFLDFNCTSTRHTPCR